MKNGRNQNGTTWLKAIACAALTLAAVFFLMTRYSCSDPTVKQEDSKDSNASESSKSAPPEEKPKKTPEGGEAPETNPKSDPGAPEPSKDNPTSGSESETKTEEPRTAPEAAEPAGASGKASDPGPGTVTDNPADEPKGESVGGLMIQGEKLGVILDNSDSMTRYLQNLRKEIRSRFRNPIFLEVEGCLLEPSSFAQGETPRSVPGSPDERESVMDAIRELIEVHNVDSIYWFSDLQDERTGAALRELDAVLKPVGSRPNGVRLYVRSTESEVDENLAKVITLSGGNFEVLK